MFYSSGVRRRDFLRASAQLGSAAFGAPAIIRAQNAVPKAEYGAMAGDVRATRAVLWSRADRASRMSVTWRTSPNGAANVVNGPYALSSNDYTGRVELADLPPGQQIFYEITFSDLSAKNSISQPVTGSFRTPNLAGDKDIVFVWSGDTCGQGWGINPAWGGMRLYETMRRAQPDFFLHSGDNIYADGPLEAELRLPDGTVWRNIVTDAKAKVAETLDDFRGNYKYNLMDENVRRFNAEVPQVWQWDDHEVSNNWSDSKDVSGDARYKEKSVPVLVANATKAFLEYAPFMASNEEVQRVYRKISYGPKLDVFVLDMRSYRGPNSYNQQATESADTAFLGPVQLEWLKAGLKSSTATWKVIAADMPIGLQVPDGADAQRRTKYEAIANSDGVPLGRELETARLLKYIRDNNIQNIVWLTADVHYTAAHFYSPDNAQFKEFLPFWEFVAGPAHAGTFGPNGLDNTFGPVVMYQKVPPAGQSNLAPSAGYQFFGEVRIGASASEMIVTLRDLTGAALFQKTLQPAR